MCSRFWRSVDLTGNQTNFHLGPKTIRFWRSVDLTGNQTGEVFRVSNRVFWRSVDLTGNQTANAKYRKEKSFGAVSI